ncbi:hypothetical protein IFM89_013916 [Coptis chinensis]|uniref:Uncharacterized protein n=1 Tax=Coptis chinensis TaxID=261450 RepID=A0A835HEW8_9MAGN|nr:hypothetical protein IFM89_013916 [Coptis chinensis]
MEETIKLDQYEYLVHNKRPNFQPREEEEEEEEIKITLLQVQLFSMNQQKKDTQPFFDLLSKLLTTVQELASLSENTHIQRELFTDFALLVHQFTPILEELRESYIIEKTTIIKSLESLHTELKRAITLIQNGKTTCFFKQIEEVAHDLGRCLGLVFIASVEDFSVEMKQKIGALQKTLMNAKFSEIGFSQEVEEEIQEDRIELDVDGVGLKLKCGDDEKFKCTLLGLRHLLTEKMVSNESVIEEDIIPILVNRLASSKQDNRFNIIVVLRILASENDDNKEKMADVESLRTLVRSLTRDAEERRETVGLLLSLSEIPAVRKRIGRIQGCIVMLVALLNGDDRLASKDARMLLRALSSNTQDVLHMAEAGYFKPLVQHLNEGSDMSKILMATAISRMELIDQTSASLGEEGAIEPLVKLFRFGKLEAKLCALGALRNLSCLTENVHRLVKSGVVESLLQLLFSITSVLMTLREPAAAILASIAQSDSILVNQDVAQQMLSLLNLSSPVIQYHLLCALNNIASHSSASKVRNKMKESGAVQLLLPFLTENKTQIRTIALNFLYNVSKDFAGELTEQLGETYLNIIVKIISATTCEDEKAAAAGLLGNLPVNDKKATEILKKGHLLSIIVSLLGSTTIAFTPARIRLVENVADILVRFTVPSDKKLQLLSAEQGVIPCLVKLLSIGSPVAKCRAATSLMQLSQNTQSLSNSKPSRWLCISPTTAHCEVHDGYCSIKSSFCLVKAGAITPLIQILEGKERDADEAVLCALATLLQDEIWEKGSNVIVKALGVQALTRVLEVGSFKAQEKALWVLERIFRLETNRVQYGEPAQVILIDLAQHSAPALKSKIAKILAHLELLQMQSDYFNT